MLTNKLSILRRHMRDLGIKYFLVLSNDAHASEYVSAADGKFVNLIFSLIIDIYVCVPEF